MRRNIILSVFLALVVTDAFSQASLLNARKKSWHCLVYRVPADTAEKYINEYMVSLQHFLEERPYATWHADSLRYEELPNGNYLLLSVQGNELVAEYYCQSNLRVWPVNNQHRVQLEIKDSMGNFISNAAVWVNKKQLDYREEIRGFELGRMKAEEAILKIAIPGDTLFMELSAMETIDKNGWQQWWKNFAYTRTGNIITWPVRKVRHMITTPANSWFRKRYRGRVTKNGYMIFNKPKYQPGDTVKLKAYILTRRGRQYKKGLTIHLEYSSNRGYIDKKIARIKPTTPGAFVYEFVPGDSLESDRTYNIAFKNRKGASYMRGGFKMEDYLLDEVASYTLRTAKDNYFRHDSLVFYANAKDANGLALMDGRVNLYLLTAGINRFYKDREFVPDTLWKGEKTLAVEGDTKFEIPARDFPDADLSIRAVAEFRNSNNEIQEEERDISFTSKSQLVVVKEDGTRIVAEYLENGVKVSKDGFLSYNNERTAKKIHFPYYQKIDPFVKEYSFWIEDEKGKRVTGEDFETDRYAPSFNRWQQKDTCGFYLHNPKGIPVHYTVFNGNDRLVTATDTTEWISWKKVLPAKKIYQVEWNYIWAGEDLKGNNTIALLDKILQTEISSQPMVYPGQRDTIKVVVKDYKGRPAAHVNLTAVSYNSQFKNEIRVNEPPYIQRFRFKRRILFDGYELDDAGFSRRFLLGKHQEWRKKFGLDSMQYYRLLFPDSGYSIISSLVNDFTPQLAVHVVEKGIPQEIYMLYVNREFAWYNGVTDPGNYALMVMPGYTQVGVRLRDKYIEIDSIYLQPSYKHDISIDTDHLPANAKVIERNDYYEYSERAQIERQIWQLENDSRTNYGYVWQNNKVIHIATTYRSHLVGPFSPGDSLQFFQPGDFDSKFPFESGYRYRLTPGMTRLERKSVFPDVPKIFLPKVLKTEWRLGDTVAVHPQISYEKKPRPAIVLKPNDTYGPSPATNTGSLKMQLPPDTSFLYAVLYSVTADTTITRIRSYDVGSFRNIKPGTYHLVLVTRHYQYLVAGNIAITANGTFCLQFPSPLYSKTNLYVEELSRRQEEMSWMDLNRYRGQETRKADILLSARSLPAGTGMITGVVTDKKGKSPIPGAVVYIKGYNSGTTTGVDGRFMLKNVRGGDYILVFSSVGYTMYERSVQVVENDMFTADVQLTMSLNKLEEVVVVGYGTTRKMSLTGSVSSVHGKEVVSLLQGKISGVMVTDASDARIVIRGARSVAIDAKPLYVIDGVAMDELPEGFDISKAQVTVLKDATATSIWGARAGNGVIMITSAGFLPGDIRDKFRDYAFWQPNLFTDANGEASFPVTYPDNITGWETYVVGMDKKRRFTKAISFAKSFKPLLTQLSAPQFLIEGDSSHFIGKTINYTSTNARVSMNFSLGGKTLYSDQKEVGANGAVTDALAVTAGNTDTITAQYSITTTTGYKDGEQRKVPIFRKGIEETVGDFWVLDKDTTFSFTPDQNAGAISFYAQNNTLDVLLDEIKQLKAYPWYCMEQSASRLTGLLMERKIMEALKESFKGEKDIQKLLGKLQKAQLFDGGWSWWEGGEANLSVTNYVLQALLQLRGDALVETNIRNGLLFLQNKLPGLAKDQMLNVLFTLSESGHEMAYAVYLKRLIFDSLTIHQQWQVVRIRQQQQLGYEQELKTVMGKQIGTMLGGVYWGDESFYWENNSMATTVLAFRVLSGERDYHLYLKQMIQFFLERRKGGRWRNTVESARVVSTILPYLLKDNKIFTAKSRLLIRDVGQSPIDTFPFSVSIANPGRPVAITKSGGGLLYLSAWQKIFNQQPEPVTDKFVIATWFERTGNRVLLLKAGEKTTMKITIRVLKDAEYVQVEIPIPAGCTYAEKRQSDWKTHKEFLKSKMVMFVENMKKGEYEYEIELEPRYSGTYQLNPAKAELMYFPVFYGRNEMKRVPVIQ